MARKIKPWEKSRSIKGKRISKKEKILIVCGGEETEPNYFRSFPVKKEIVEVNIKPEGKDPGTLLNIALDIINKAEKREESYNQCWIVFDKDDFTHNVVFETLRKAERHKIKTAYSIECFELWYLLHFNYINTGISRKDYINKLNKLLPEKYKKNSKIIYEQILDKQSEAIRNSKKLLSEYEDLYNPTGNNPSTTVYELVEELNRFIE